MPEKNSTKQSSAKSSPKSARPFIPAEWREWLLADLSGPELSVYLAYWAHANGDDLAWPSLRSLSKTTGYGINALKKARRQLISKGLLIPVEQKREGGQFGRKVFRVYWSSSLRHSTVGHKECHGTAAHSTVAPSTVGHKECQEGSPSEGSPSKGQQAAEVRKVRSKERVSHDGPTDGISGISLTGKTWDRLSVLSLPQKYARFVGLVERNPLEPSEDIVAWGKCLLDLCDEKSIEYPKVFLLRIKDAERSASKGNTGKPKDYRVDEGIYAA
jgi:hypothetical protein